MKRLLCVLAAACVLPAWAEDNVLLVRQGPDGFTVWHTEGESELSEDELLDIMATATPEGGTEVETPVGPARAFELPAGIMVRLPAAPRDNALLVDRDACGHVVVWHAAGATQLTDTELTEAVLSALPEGGPRIRLGDRYAKAFIGRLGVTVTLWKVPAKR
ncbi:MAG: hypothetical protein RBS28_04060 [Rhodocyclaceae bacterium]|nr:hypothetical protein [Rhodocyclaceae bacterium]